ncbi:MAG: SusC/RagA family TonB-linked outer membrane protein [Saprospiraceae bacterium]|nr:SusC/RagA family TonB-linked outer membrane protein [Saprospiraceae bacterium]
MKKLSLLLLMVFCAVGLTMAQRTVSGQVVDDTGEPLIGANVVVKGTTAGTVTDFDGNYTLQVPEDGTTLVFSYTGYSTQELEIGSSSVINVTMSEGVELGEVVVTGLGIKREKKALGYGVSTISSESLTARSEADVARILRGKATGVDITQTSGIAGSGTNVIIRGYSSITGDNQPLFVVDGVPFNSDTNTDRGFTQGGATASSRFLDLDANNIAEISILKGLSATVLYGEAGRNGVILITTKNGNVTEQADKGFEVSFSQSISQTEVANLPTYQNEFGNGFSGNFGWFFSNWGPSFSIRGSNGIDENGQVDHPYDQAQYNDDFPEFIGQRYDYRSYMAAENFFDKGLASNTSISVDKSFDGGAVSASYSYLQDEGFVPDRDDGTSGNEYNRHNFGLGASANLSNGITVRGTFNFISSDRLAPPASTGFGSNPSGASLFANLIYTPRSIDLLNLPYESPLDGSMVYYRRGSAIQNPLWTLHNAWDTEDLKRFFGSFDISFAIVDGLTLNYRAGVDQYAQKNVRAINRGGSQVPDGQLFTSDRKNVINDHVLNLAYTYDLSEDFDIDGIVGVNLRREKNEFSSVNSSNQFVPKLLTHQNFVDHSSSSFVSDENTIGAYVTATLGFRDFLYLGLQARNDWTSVLEEDNRSNFYPSASISFVPTDAIPSLQSSTVLNYLKLRAGYGTSAGYPGPYQTRNVLSTRANVFLTPGGTTVNTNSVSNRLGNPNLGAEKHSELEFGVEARFLQNRIGIDASYYNKQSTDLIIDLDLDPATGFTNTTVNAAEVENNGIELGINLVPVKGDFTWDMTLNYTKNNNDVISIAEGVDQVLIAGFTNQGNFAVPGEPFGVIKGTPFQKNDAGELLVGADGNYVPGGDIETIANPNPNYTANWINSFSWKGLRLGFQWSYTDGGDILSYSTATMLARGLTEDTNVDRFLPIILPGVLATDESTPNNIQGYIGDYFFRAYFFADEGLIFDGTVIRLREVSLSYDLPQSILDNLPIGSASITLSGENLWYNAPNFPEHVNFDPEVLSLGVGNGRGFDYITGPTSKKYGVTLNLTF